MQLFVLQKGEKVKDRVCAYCKWFENLPFADEGFCKNENSEFADCPCDDPSTDTCEEWTPINEDE